MNTIMLDSLVGNDYSLCLCNGLKRAGVEVSLVVPKNKEINSICTFEVFKWAPPKSGALSKWTKGKDYLAYLVRVFRLIREKNVVVVHFQFLRRILFSF
jgi:hypothetical protein